MRKWLIKLGLIQEIIVLDHTKKMSVEEAFTFLETKANNLSLGDGNALVLGILQNLHQRIKKLEGYNK